MVGTNHIVLLVRDVDASSAEALGYIRSLRPQSLHPITPGLTLATELGERWAAFAGPTHAGTDAARRPAASPGAFAATSLSMDLAPADVVTLVVPEMVGDHLTSHVVHTKDLVRLKAAMLAHPACRRHRRAGGEHARGTSRRRCQATDPVSHRGPRVPLGRERPHDPCRQLCEDARRQHHPRDLLRPRPGGRRIDSRRSGSTPASRSRWTSWRHRSAISRVRCSRRCVASPPIPAPWST